MTPEELREKIRIATVNFTDEVSAIFGDAFASVAAEFKTGSLETHAAPSKAGSARPKPVRKVAKTRIADKPIKAKAAKPAKAKGEKRNRRSASELDRVGGDVIKLLSSTKRSMRVEEINKEIGTSTRQLMRPIQKLLANGKIKKTGERRATTYYI